MTDAARPAFDPALAGRLRQALTASEEQLFGLVGDPSMAVLANLLKNPTLGEEHLLALLKRRDLSEDLLKSVHRHPLTGSSHRVKLELVKNPQTPAPVALTLLPHLFLFELLDLCLLPGTTPDQRYAAERQLIQRLPTTELGQKLTLARRSGGAILEALVTAGDKPVLEIALDSPRLRELALLKFLRSGRATAETISLIARHPRWSQRKSLQQAILKHRRTPAIWYTLWLPRLKAGELRALMQGRTLGMNQKKLVEAELAKRGR